MIIGHVSDFLPECKSKRIVGLFIHHAGTFGTEFVSILLELMLAESKSGSILTPKDKKKMIRFHRDLCILVERSLHELDLIGSQEVLYYIVKMFFLSLRVFKDGS